MTIQIDQLLLKVINLPPDKSAELLNHYRPILDKFLKCEINALYIHILENEINIQEQIQLPCKTLVILTNNSSTFNPDRVSIMQLPGDDLVNALYQNVHYTINPLFLKSTAGIQSKTVPVTKKKLAEVELALVQLQNNVEIPTVNLQIHPQVLDFLQQQGDKPIIPDDIPKSLTENGHLLNELQTFVNEWLKNIKILMSLQRDPRSGSAAQEISFWLDLEKTLEFVESQLKSPGVSATLLILQQARRFHGSASFIQDTGLRETLRQAKSYNFLFQDFPISDLLSATSLPQMTTGIQLIFEHLTKKAKIAPYPVSKLLHFLEALSKDVNDQAIRIINGKSLMGLPKSKFDDIANDFSLLFKCWDDHFKEFGTICRELLRKRAEAFVPYKIINGHDKLQQRIQFISQFRNNHETLRSALEEIIKQQNDNDTTSLNELDTAYELFTPIDVLDTSVDGQDLIQSSEQTYNTRISRIESQLIEMLRRLLKNADTPQQMLLIFIKYHMLLGRATIRGSLLEFQSMTLEYLKSHIKQLQTEYVGGYMSSKLKIIHHAKGIPIISGRIMWVKHVEKQMASTINQLKALLGNISTHYEGNKLLEEYKIFSQKIDISHALENWVNELQQIQTTKCFNKSILLINNNAISVNFSKHVLNVYRECRNLQFLNIKIPINIQQFSKEIKKIYPFVIALFNYFYQAVSILNLMSLNDICLISNYSNSFYHLITCSHTLNWSLLLQNHSTTQTNITNGTITTNIDYSTNALQFHVDLVCVSNLIKQQSKRVQYYNTQLSNLVNQLNAINPQSMSNLATKAQALFDQMHLDGLNNIVYYYEQWLLNTVFPKLNNLVTLIFTQLITKIDFIKSMKMSSKLSMQSINENAIGHIQQELNGLGFQCVMRIENQQITTEPPLLESLEWLLEFVNTTLNTYAMSINPDRYSPNKCLNVSDYPTYMSHDIILTFYTKIQLFYTQSHQFLTKMNKYQGLLKLEPHSLTIKLNNNTPYWLKIISEIKKDKSHLEAHNGLQLYGPILIDYTQVKSQLISKYDTLLLYCHTHFTKLILQQTTSYMHLISQYKSGLEVPSELHQLYPDLNIFISNQPTISLFLFIHHINTQLPSINTQLQALQAAHVFIHRQQIQLPPDWRHLEHLESLVMTFKHYLKHKMASLGSIMEVVVAYSQVFIDNATQLIQQWDLTKDLSKHLNLNTCATELIAMNKARELLNLQILQIPELGCVLTEINDLQSVLDKVNLGNSKLHDIGQMPWPCDPKLINSHLNAILLEFDQLPLFYAQYPHVIQFKQQVSHLLTNNTILYDLSSPAIHEKHWIQLGATKPKIINDIWQLNIINNTNYKQLISTANGEYNLHLFINECKSCFTSLQIQTFHYKSKCFLLSSVNDIFTNCEEYTMSLTAMTASPYYKSFDQECAYWQSKINNIYNLFKLILEVQLLYMHLEGAMQHVQTSDTFPSLELEFTQLMAQVHLKQDCMAIIMILNINQTCQRILKGFIKLQKSLSAYLEAQRCKFPRFYFMSDGDLLGLIGDFNVRLHIQKLFPNIHDLVIEDGIKSVVGPLQDVFELLTPVPITQLIPTLQQFEKTLHKSLEYWYLHSLSDVVLVWETPTRITELILNVPYQILELLIRTTWTMHMEQCMPNTGAFVGKITALINELLVQLQVTPNTPLRTLKLKNLIKELLALRKVTQQCDGVGIGSFTWLQYTRSYCVNDIPVIRIGNSEFAYKYEYYGTTDKLIRTALTDVANMTMMFSLQHKLGTSPSGPAGTGKTESVKQMAQLLGILCVVFCCDEAFDYSVMRRILNGLECIGAWGCFDEFNRLQVGDMQLLSNTIHDLLIKSDIGIFITMNPTYKGRNVLPPQLTRLFRPVKMEIPDLVDIAEALLYCDGFMNSGDISKQLVRLFNKCDLYLSHMAHYDFGLRALKSVLMNAGRLEKGENEIACILEALTCTVAPKLTVEDLIKFDQFVVQVFNRATTNVDAHVEIQQLLKQHNLSLIMAHKINEFIKIHDLVQGFMVVGEQGTGKSTCIALGKEILNKRMKIKQYLINAKVITKHALYGALNPVSKEWKDGIFTHVLRQCVMDKTHVHWIIFDCDVDPIWCENLNSVLDDNKTLTLPNGERIVLHDNIKLIFEVPHLEHATPATVSRNGILYFDTELIPIGDIVVKYVNILVNKLQDTALLASLLEAVPVICDIYNKSIHLSHVMDYKLHFYLNSFINYYHGAYVSNNGTNTSYILVKSLFYASCGDVDEIGDYLTIFNNLVCSIYSGCVYTTMLVNEQVVPISSLLSDTISINPNSNAIIPTIDTIRNESLVVDLLHANSGFILCGPAGSGKTMSLSGALKKQSKYAVCSLNFSSDTSVNSIIYTLKQQCDLVKTPTGMLLIPKMGKILVLFCDEINLVQPDDYGTQLALSFIWQLITNKCYYDMLELVKIQNIIIIGACNPPSYSGRIPIDHRLLRLLPVVYVGYPSKESLIRIYTNYCDAILRNSPCATNINNITLYMVNCYLECKTVFPSSKQSHYIYSPRELSRWIKGIQYYVKQQENAVVMSDLVPLLVYEGHRLFHDRLVDLNEQEQCVSILINMLSQCGLQMTHITDMCYSSWMSKAYIATPIDQLHAFLQQRLKTFNLEESNSHLYLTNQSISHLSRIDRILKQPNGHGLLFGMSASGRKSLAHFACWLNGIQVEILSVYNGYSIDAFDTLLRSLMKTILLHNKPVCLIIDDTMIIEPAFIERMNTLLANSEIPGLFDVDEYTQLVQQCQDIINKSNLEIDVADWIIQQITQHMHVLFTMQFSPTNTVNTQSPALFNRCVVNFMGDWTCDTFKSICQQSLPKDVENSDGICNVLMTHHMTQQTSPMVFLHCLDLFKSCILKKQSEIQEQQQHYNTGLDKLNTSVTLVATLKAQLQIKNTELVEKQEIANTTLKEMVKKQQEAEMKKQESIQISEELNKQQIMISERSTVVKDQLSECEPKVEMAKQSVSEIKKQHLTEIRSMANPPLLIKQTMECICLMLGQKPDTWKTVQQIVRKDDFINSIIDYNTDGLANWARKLINNDYLNNPQFNIDNVNRASKACGPLFTWMVAQLEYSEILTQIGPLRNELNDLHNKHKQAQIKYTELTQLVTELTSNISKYQQEYTQLVAQVEQIKNELSVVSTKVNKSELLMTGLDSEQQRWTILVNQFMTQLQSIIGDALLESIFIAYLGKLPPNERQSKVEYLYTLLDSHNITYSTNMSLSDLLIDQKDKLHLERDAVIYENHGISTKSMLPLLIIGSPNDIIAINKSQQTTFQSTNYAKILENCIRFGNTCIIHNCIPMDPLLMPLLNKQYVKQGGRLLIQLGKQLIEASPSFKLILSTPNMPSNALGIVPYVYRTCPVNYQTSESSLTHKITNLLLFHYHPKLHAQLLSNLKDQLSYNQELIQLEHALLLVLQQPGNLLDNDAIIGQLTEIKKQSTEINLKLSNNNQITSDITNKCDAYKVFSAYASQLYFKLIDLIKVDDFTQIVSVALNTSNALDMVPMTFTDLIYATICQRLPQSAIIKMTLTIFITFMGVFHSNIPINDILIQNRNSSDPRLQHLINEMHNKPQEYLALLLAYASEFNLKLNLQKLQQLQIAINNKETVLVICKEDVVLHLDCKIKEYQSELKQGVVYRTQMDPKLKLINTFYIEHSYTMSESYFNTFKQMINPQLQSQFKPIIFKMTWFHLVIQQRLQHVPIGMYDAYNVNDSDFECLMRFINGYCNKENKVDLGMFVKIMKMVYLPKIMNAYDVEIVEILIHNIMSGTGHESEDMDQFYHTLGNGAELVELDANINVNIARMEIQEMLNGDVEMRDNNALEMVIGWIDGLPVVTGDAVNKLILKMKQSVQGIRDYYKGEPSMKIDGIISDLNKRRVPEEWCQIRGLGDLEIFINHIVGCDKEELRHELEIESILMGISGEDGFVGLIETGEIELGELGLYGCLYDGNRLNMKNGKSVLYGKIGKIGDIGGFIDLPIYRNEKRREYMGKIYIKCDEKELVRLRSSALYLQ